MVCCVVWGVQVLILACLLAYCAGNPFSVTQHHLVDIGRVQQEVQTFGSEKIGQGSLRHAYHRVFIGSLYSIFHSSVGQGHSNMHTRGCSLGLCIPYVTVL